MFAGSLLPAGYYILMNKSELTERIRDSHRQLMRYLFFFEMNDGGSFLPTDRPKFNNNEMSQPGAVGPWSVKDLLVHLLFWEQRLVNWLHNGPLDQTPEGIPPADLDWNQFEIDNLEPSHLAFKNSLPEILANIRSHYQEVIAAIEEIPEEDLFTSGAYRWTGQGSVADFIAIYTYSHYDWAKRHLRSWRRAHAGKYLNKEVVLERILVERRRLEKNLQHLSDDQMQEPGIIDSWSIKDILAHLADWEQRFIHWYQAGLRGEVPAIPAPGISWEELDTLNNDIFEKHRTRALQDIVSWFSSSYLEFLGVVKAIPEEDMFQISRYLWLGRSNLVSYILANSANHYRWGNSQIRKWRKLKGI